MTLTLNLVLLRNERRVINLLVSNGVNPKSIGAITRGGLATQDYEPAKPEPRDGTHGKLD